jgi:hypothetical protein
MSGRRLEGIADMTTAETGIRARGWGLGLGISVAAFLFALDALVLNAVCFSLICGLFVVMVGVPLSFIKRHEAFRRQTLIDIAIYLLVSLVPVIVMVNVNAHVAHARAERLIAAIECCRTATGAYPRELADLVPEFIDRVPRAQYTLIGSFSYVYWGTEKPPSLWYNPHAMDHRIYDFKTKKWGYLD